ncbi:hypothetical protein LX32DRAFT_646487 [Colletotrichum zoysiae]|uniref:Uncharacterized protein n=1 Tax=Colletotrichum zoysiae TaxID=1216348 RepID=A0AAD9H4J5_9PEZI|nr:hypothetical protein LX32DRAFT_646487 [Colletotrichum zoysiae]
MPFFVMLMRACAQATAARLHFSIYETPYHHWRVPIPSQAPGSGLAFFSRSLKTVRYALESPASPLHSCGLP